MKNCKVALMSVADIRNYGDVLFSFIARQEISKRIPNAEFRFFCPTEQIIENEKFYSYTRKNLNEYNPDAILVVGGEVIHKYDKTWDKMYKNIAQKIPAGKVSDTFFDWLDYDKAYKAYFSVGALLRYNDTNKLDLNDLKKMDYIGARGLYSKKNLEENLWTINPKIDLVPDIGWVFGRLCPNFEETIFQISKTQNIDLAKNNYIVFNTNSTAINEEKISAVKEQLNNYAKENNTKVVILSITKTYNEYETLKNFEADNCILLPDNLSTKEKLALLLGAKFYIGSSLHSAITTMNLAKPAILIHNVMLQKFQDLYNHMFTPEYLNDSRGWDNIMNLLEMAEKDFKNADKTSVRQKYVDFMESTFDLKINTLCENIICYTNHKETQNG